MYYINSKPSKNGNYGNPRGEPFDGALKLPDELLNDYIDAKGFAYFEATKGAITSVKLNREAYNAYINSQPEPAEDKQSKIAELKRNLADTDYIACKIAEGAATREEYADVIAQRQAWREEINRLEVT
ncbi:MAG: hypothetical protein IJP43_06205 [Oscillospiraceae bacterium]|nr:hypothetical protein [Oscillospiraceae bacterium]